MSPFRTVTWNVRNRHEPLKVLFEGLGAPAAATCHVIVVTEPPTVAVGPLTPKRPEADDDDFPCCVPSFPGWHLIAPTGTTKDKPRVALFLNKNLIRTQDLRDLAIPGTKAVVGVDILMPFGWSCYLGFYRRPKRGAVEALQSMAPFVRHDRVVTLGDGNANHPTWSLGPRPPNPDAERHPGRL